MYWRLFVVPSAGFPAERRRRSDSDTTAGPAPVEEKATDEKRCLVSANNEHRRLMPTGTERRGNKKMKYLAIIAVAVMALGLGACASKTAASTSTSSTTASHGYSK